MGKMRFSTEIAVYLGNGTTQTHGWITTRKLQVAERSLSVLVTLSNFEKRDAYGQIFL